jgi:hypothetical protein
MKAMPQPTVVAIVGFGTLRETDLPFNRFAGSMQYPPNNKRRASGALSGTRQSANHFRLTRYKSGNTKKLSASQSRDRSVAGQRYANPRVVWRGPSRPAPAGRRGDVFEPTIKAVAASKNFMPQCSRSKMPREFVKAPCL